MKRKHLDTLYLGKIPYLFTYRDFTASGEYHVFHAHAGLEFLFVQEGKGHLVLEHKVYPVESGMLIVFQPFQLHRIQMSPGEGPYARSVVLFDPLALETYVQPFLGLKKLLHHLWRDRLAQHIFPLGASAAEFDRLYCKLSRRLEHMPATQHMEDFSLFLLNLLSLFRDDCLKPGIPRVSVRPTRHAETIMEWIEHHYREPFALERLAHELHLSSHHLSRVFSKDTGGTITDYLTARRIKEACLLLVSTDKPVQEIGRMVGLTNDSYFSQMFKKQVGVSPLHYRMSEEKNDLQR